MKYDPKIVTEWFKENGIPEPTYEYKFHSVRRWKMDIAWPEQKVFLEVQGGIFVNGRHSRGAAMLKEWDKVNAASCMGWRILYCQPKDVCTIDMVDVIKTALNQHRRRDGCGINWAVSKGES